LIEKPEESKIFSLPIYFIVQGNKRSYGDVALNKKLLISMKNFKIEISRLSKKRKLSSYFSERLGI
jgi:hypothetical protein